MKKLLAVAVMWSAAVFLHAQNIQMDVTVHAKNGAPVTGLTRNNFTLTNNGTPQQLSSVREIRQPAHVVIVLDGVNTRYDLLLQTRDKVVKWLRSYGGKMPQPTTIGYFTDAGMRDVMKFSTDGNALADALQKYPLGLRQMREQQASEGDLVMLSYNQLQRLSGDMAKVPGYKAIMWISPGWPLMGIPEDRLAVHADLRQKIYDHVSGLLTVMQQNHIRLYGINSLGAVQSSFEADVYKDFIGGLAKPEQAEVGNLSLQVLAEQSGGEALATGNDIGEMLSQCYADTQDFYELTFAAPKDKAPYHKLTLKTDRTNLVVDAMQGYYQR